MIKGKSKKPKKTEEPDFSALDEAVSELSKQTAAILGGGSDKKTEDNKPTLPKRGVEASARARSFDIISPTTKSEAMKSHLKTVSKNQQYIDAISEPDTIATDTESLEENNNAAPQVDSSSEAAAEQPEIILHRRGKLSLLDTDEAITEPEEADSKEAIETDPKEENKETETEPTAPSTEEPSEHSEPKGDEPAAVEDIKSDQPEPSFSSDGAASLSLGGESKSTEPIKLDEPDKAEAKPAEPKDAEKDKTAEPDPKPEKAVDKQEPTTSSEGSGELFANNLVSQSDPKRYEPNENQQKPTVFDTNEYHPELNDWSKLERRSGSGVILLLLLALIAAGIGYWLISGKEISFL